MNQITKFALLTTLLLPVTIYAYVGPGAGISFIGALWAVIVAVLLAIGGFLAWPIRTLLRKRKLKKQELDKSEEIK
jgi:hypothetical protein